METQNILMKLFIKAIVTLALIFAASSAWAAIEEITITGPGKGEITYDAKEGTTYSEMAQEMYNNPAAWPILEAANGYPPEKIPQGAKLKVPVEITVQAPYTIANNEELAAILLTMNNSLIAMEAERNAALNRNAELLAQFTDQQETISNLSKTVEEQQGIISQQQSLLSTQMLVLPVPAPNEPAVSTPEADLSNTLKSQEDTIAWLRGQLTAAQQTNVALTEEVRQRYNYLLLFTLLSLVAMGALVTYFHGRMNKQKAYYINQLFSERVEFNVEDKRYVYYPEKVHTEDQQHPGTLVCHYKTFFHKVNGELQLVTNLQDLAKSVQRTTAAVFRTKSATAAEKTNLERAASQHRLGLMRPCN